MEKLRDDHIHPHIDRFLFLRLYLFFFFAIALFIYVIREIIIGDIGILSAIMGVSFGFALGGILGRLMGIEWDDKKSKVVSRIDVVGAFALLSFILLDIYREWIFGHWFSGLTLSLVTLCFLSGAILGRFVGMKTSIMYVLKERNIVRGNPEEVL